MNYQLLEVQEGTHQLSGTDKEKQQIGIETLSDLMNNISEKAAKKLVRHFTLIILGVVCFIIWQWQRSKGKLICTAVLELSTNQITHFYSKKKNTEEMIKKAIIHNSNYGSVDECQCAINRYFEDRNQFFRENPTRADNKIWGKELAVPIFNEAATFKDARWR